MTTIALGPTTRTSDLEVVGLHANAQPGGWVLLRDRFVSDDQRARLARVYLHPLERALEAELDPRRWRSWLLGRVAAKDAVRHVLASAGIDLAPDLFAVDRDERGRPRLVGLDDLAPRLHVSIAHTDGCAVALATDRAAVGIDVQTIEDRGPSFSRVAFTKGERLGRHLSGVDDRVWMTASWCAKAAVSKALGTGLQGRPASFETRVAGPGVLAVRDRFVRWIQLDSATASAPDGHALVVAWTLVPQDVIDLGRAPR